MKWALQVPQLTPWGGCPGHSTGRGTQAELDGPTETRRQSQEPGEAKAVRVPRGEQQRREGSRDLQRPLESSVLFTPGM